MSLGRCYVFFLSFEDRFVFLDHTARRRCGIKKNMRYKPPNFFFNVLSRHLRVPISVVLSKLDWFGK